MKKYDLLVIGAGPGGTPAAMAAAQFGKSVLLVDKRGALGGECLFEGCIPSKVLENAANRFNMLKEAKAFHADFSGEAQIHWEGVLAEKERLLEMRANGAMGRLKQLSTLTFQKGKVKFVDANSAEIDGELIGFRHAIVATGAKAFVPPFEGTGVADAWVNADVFKHKEIPKEMIFVGAGAISCELVQMFVKLGTKCTLLERGDRILKRVDRECALKLQEKMIQDGVQIELNVHIDKIDKDEKAFVVQYTKDSKEYKLQTDHVLIATGRAANVEDLGLEKAGVEFDRHGIKTDATLQTTQENIYATGDCGRGPKFAHWATYEAGIAIHNIYAPTKHKIDPDKLSWVLFSDPQIASVGLDEESAKNSEIEVVVERYDYRSDARAQIDKATLGMVKFVIDKKSGVIIGIQIFSEDASSLVGEASLIVSAKMTPMQVMSAIHPHPTLTEAFGNLARTIFFKSMMKRG